MDSTLKELKQAKADTQNARASESTAQRKLAHTEADLKQAKDEAAIATKEVQQARADAQVARQSKAEAERKLAESEAARTAAEEREQAWPRRCQKSIRFRGAIESVFRA